MYTVREYINLSGDNNVTQESQNLVYTYLDSIQYGSADAKAKKLLLQLHELNFGPHFDIDIAIDAVAKMENIDGTTGAYWKYAEVEEEAKKRNIEHPADLYYAMNMLYSDLSNVLGKDPNKYLAIAKALYWDDPDMPEGKLFKQYVATL